MVLTSPLCGFKCQWHPCLEALASHIGPEFATKRSRVDTPTLYGSTPDVPRPGSRFMNMQPSRRAYEWKRTGKRPPLQLFEDLHIKTFWVVCSEQAVRVGNEENGHLVFFTNQKVFIQALHKAS